MQNTHTPSFNTVTGRGVNLNAAETNAEYSLFFEFANFKTSLDAVVVAEKLEMRGLDGKMLQVLIKPAHGLKVQDVCSIANICNSIADAALWPTQVDISSDIYATAITARFYIKTA